MLGRQVRTTERLDGPQGGVGMAGLSIDMKHANLGWMERATARGPECFEM